MFSLYLNQTKPLGIKLIGLVIPAFLLSACQIVGPNYERPELVVPAQFTEAADQAPNKISNTWWTQYQDQLLNDLVNKALQNNTDIKLAVARIEESEASAREVGAATFPQIDLNADASRTRVTELGANPVSRNPRSNYKAQLGTSFEIDFWGKLSRAKESARAQVLSTQYAKDTVALSLSGLVASNYLILRSLDTQIVILQDNIKSREASLGLTKRRLEGGVSSALDVHQAEVASANLSAQLAELTRLRALSLHQLALLTGDLNLNIASADIKSLPIPPTPPAGLPSSLLEARPDIRQAEEQMIAANAKIGVAKAALYPTISLTAGLGGESLELGDILKSAARIWTGGLNLYLPIFDSGRLNSKVEQASAKQKQALASYEGAVQSAFREVNDALVNLRQNTERETALNTSQQAAKKALEISENRYQSGYSAYLDVLDAQRVYNDAALSYVQSRQVRLVATVELFKALGGGWQESDVQQVK
ncbi:efflux transporter outer membrane subunit [Methylotenera sp.]|uniref:efflux transporter outer membrane subunit n=1 Tax=Methylotenera sp. TaxID=2051956 RepID=UPI00273014A0|nr:efflux transporter outer membrane subunit [Methylotenera sp.]MDP2071388.1 efflux transporter outer membrane subunit [Methylotenera sp.]MDP3005349.1 efflux transporter outer membrane subunit [Methylotenera sp.]